MGIFFDWFKLKKWSLDFFLNLFDFPFALARLFDIVREVIIILYIHNNFFHLKGIAFLILSFSWSSSGLYLFLLQYSIFLSVAAFRIFLQPFILAILSPSFPLHQSSFVIFPSIVFLSISAAHFTVLSIFSVLILSIFHRILLHTLAYSSLWKKVNIIRLKCKTINGFKGKIIFPFCP